MTTVSSVVGYVTTVSFVHAGSGPTKDQGSIRDFFSPAPPNAKRRRLPLASTTDTALPARADVPARVHPAACSPATGLPPQAGDCNPPGLQQLSGSAAVQVGCVQPHGKTSTPPFHKVVPSSMTATASATIQPVTGSCKSICTPPTAAAATTTTAAPAAMSILAAASVVLPSDATSESVCPQVVDGRHVWLLETRVVGIRHKPNSQHMSNTLLSRGASLQREPQNPVDTNAILVSAWGAVFQTFCKFNIMHSCSPG